MMRPAHKAAISAGHKRRRGAPSLTKANAVTTTPGGFSVWLCQTCGGKARGKLCTKCFYREKGRAEALEAAAQLCEAHAEWASEPGRMPPEYRAGSVGAARGLASEIRALGRERALPSNSGGEP